MKRILFLALSLFLLPTFLFAQAPTTATTTDAAGAKPKRVVFRATKAQVIEAQTKMKAAGQYAGEADGKMNADFRASVKTYQSSNGLRKSGSLNRATLEKMGIALSDAQKEIPIPESSYAKPTEEKPKSEKTTNATSEKPKRGPVFRATKDQINEAQRKLKAGNMYVGEETGSLDDATREGLKKYQEANGLKVTGTLNQVTLEKMGIELTDKQKENAAAEANK
jgi:Putative peptidoglycan-binding domain-containing protein